MYRVNLLQVVETQGLTRRAFAKSKDCASVQAYAIWCTLYVSTPTQRMSIMTKSTRINARIEPELKAQGDAVLAAIGLNISDAMTMFYRQLVMHQGLPFEAKIPNAETVAEMEEDLSTAKRYSSVDELMADLRS